MENMCSREKTNENAFQVWKSAVEIQVLCLTKAECWQRQQSQCPSEHPVLCKAIRGMHTGTKFWIPIALGRGPHGICVKWRRAFNREIAGPLAFRIQGDEFHLKGGNLTWRYLSICVEDHRTSLQFARFLIEPLFMEKDWSIQIWFVL